MKRIVIALLLAATLSAQTIEEKRQGLAEAASGLKAETYRELCLVNQELDDYRETLRVLHVEAEALLEEGASEAEYEALVASIKEVKQEIAWIEEAWREVACEESKEEAYALWHQPWSSLEQIIIDYGSNDYVYLIPPEVGGIRLSISSNLPVPRESWDEMLRAIFINNGIGVRQLNPYLRQLYVIEQEPMDAAYVTSERRALDTYPRDGRICFVLAPNAPDASGVAKMLARFVNQRKTTIRQVGRQLFLLGTVEAVSELLKIYDFIEASAVEKEYSMIPLSKISAKEMEAVLHTYFGGHGAEETPALKVLALDASQIFLSGPAEEIRQAKQIIEEVQGQIDDPRQMTVYTYVARHSDATELATALSGVYNLLQSNPQANPKEILEVKGKESKEDENVAVKSAMVTTKRPKKKSEKAEVAGNFVVYPKTGTIIMVVEQELLPKLKTLLQQLDIPKRMVKIDVLFFERKTEERSRFGLDLLRIGSRANNQSNRAGGGFEHGGGSGILQFFVERVARSALPAYDIAYSFLLGQEDIRINANPSVTTLNHVPATVQLVEEISIETGACLDPKFKGAAQSYARQQYGITMTLTPSITTAWEGTAGDHPVSYITLDTDVLFDTPKASKDDRPPVIRRRIKNEVRVRDGETVVLGGLRSRMREDQSDQPLPFISELPGIGKLVSSSHSRDNEDDMYIFITPHIIEDPVAELRRMRTEELGKRQGDIPEFLDKLGEARDEEKRELFARSLHAVLGR